MVDFWPSDTSSGGTTSTKEKFVIIGLTLTKTPWQEIPFRTATQHDASCPLRPQMPNEGGNVVGRRQRSESVMAMPCCKRARYSPTVQPCRSSGVMGYTATWPGPWRTQPPPRLTHRTRSCRAQLFVRQANVAAGPAPANADQPGVFAHEHHDATVHLPSGFVRQAALERQEIVVGQRAQQVEFHCERRCAVRCSRAGELREFGHS